MSSYTCAAFATYLVEVLQRPFEVILLQLADSNLEQIIRLRRHPAIEPNRLYSKELCFQRARKDQRKRGHVERLIASNCSVRSPTNSGSWNLSHSTPPLRTHTIHLYTTALMGCDPNHVDKVLGSFMFSDRRSMSTGLSGGHRAASERLPQLGGIAANPAMAGTPPTPAADLQNRKNIGRAPV
jgi:hypothetical protein